MADSSQILQKQLAESLAKWHSLYSLPRPARGWLRAIRSGLGISGVQLARTLGVHPPRIVEMEKAELEGAITLKTLDRVAEAMGCKLVYAFLPKSGSLEVTSDIEMGSELPLTQEEIQDLRLPHITNRRELLAWEQKGLRKAELWVALKKQPDILSTEFLQQLHQEIFGEIWKSAGQFRAPDIEAKLASLFENARYWHQAKTYSGDEAAIRFYHRLVSSHPFTHGSEAVCRYITDLTLTKMAQRPPLTWGRNRSATLEEKQEQLKQGMRAADGRNFGPLLALARA